MGQNIPSAGQELVKIDYPVKIGKEIGNIQKPDNGGASVFTPGEIKDLPNFINFDPIEKEPSGIDYSEAPMSTFIEEWAADREEQFGPIYDDLSKKDRDAIDKALEEGDVGEPVKDPENPGREQRQVGDMVETTTTLYYADENGNGIPFEELPEEDQAAIRDYEQNRQEIENSSLSDEEKAAALAALDVPECMESTTTETRYEKGTVGDENSKLDSVPEKNEPKDSKSKLDSVPEKNEPKDSDSKLDSVPEKEDDDNQSIYEPPSGSEGNGGGASGNDGGCSASDDGGSNDSRNEDRNKSAYRKD